jgi:UDPglucose--hexose-1-phosphate uridylyltransferase
MDERRYDLLDDRWILYVPARARRPHDVRLTILKPARPPYDPDCPFCPGNEGELETVLFERQGTAGQPWATRAVANKYPIVTGSLNGPASAQDFAGAHEVVIETPRHDLQLADMTVGELEAVLATHRARFAAHAGYAAWAVAFRNHGPTAGISLFHAHGQFVATTSVPPLAAAREARAERYVQEVGRCFLCDVIEREQREALRLVGEAPGFVAFVPYAAEVRFEVWIAPSRHQSDFAALDDPEIAALAGLIGRVLRALRAAARDPDYNFVILSASRGLQNGPAWHWYLRVRPRTTAVGGFELASGVAVNPSLPELDAARLRAETA